MLECELRKRLSLGGIRNLEQHDVAQAGFQVEKAINLPSTAPGLSAPIPRADGDSQTTAAPAYGPEPSGYARLPRGRLPNPKAFATLLRLLA